MALMRSRDSVSSTLRSHVFYREPRPFAVVNYGFLFWNNADAVLYMVNQEMTTTDTWSLIQDSNGRVLDEYSLRKVTFSKVYYLTGFTISAHAAGIDIYCLHANYNKIYMTVQLIQGPSRSILCF